MLSILIPCYNYSSYNLVKTLYNQCIDLKIAFEILVSEDAGKRYLEVNQKINALKNCQYLINQTNLGRAGNINRLLKIARYNLKLVLDCDVIPQHNNFIKTYIDIAENHYDLVCFGGIAYDQNDKLKDNLRYNYGIKREAKPAFLRQNKPFKYLLTSNLLLKNCDQIFDERIQTYGYEDLVFANELEQRNINILHIDNFVFHISLEDNNTYLRKTQIATKNLINMEKQNILPKSQTKMSKLYHQIKVFHLVGVLDILYNIFNKKIAKRLIKKGCPIWIYDLYKLLYFSKNY